MDDREIEWRQLPAFNVNVTTPADRYQLTDRATKYAILLISLTFMAFFVFESLTQCRLHPMQYLLVGLSLVMFYLILLALSEHIGFTPSWIVASLIGALINGVYLNAVLKGWLNSFLLSAHCCCWMALCGCYCVRKIARCYWERECYCWRSAR